MTSLTWPLSMSAVMVYSMKVRFLFSEAISPASTRSLKFFKAAPEKLLRVFAAAQ